MRFVLALVASTVVISLSDWLFFGVAFHDRYMRTPEVWRDIPEGKRIGGSMLLAAIGVAAYLRLLSNLGVHDNNTLCMISLFTWVAASLPQTVTNTLYIKYAAELAITHSLGWLARIVIAALAYHFLLM